MSDPRQDREDQCEPGALAGSTNRVSYATDPVLGANDSKKKIVSVLTELVA